VAADGWVAADVQGFVGSGKEFGGIFMAKWRRYRWKLTLMIALLALTALLFMGNDRALLLVYPEGTAGREISDIVINISAERDIPLYSGFRLIFPSSACYVRKADYADMVRYLEEKGVDVEAYQAPL